MTENRYSLRSLLFFGALACAAMIGIALYLQYQQDLEPCPLCIFQRVFVIASGLIMGTAALHNPAETGRRIYGLLLLIPGLAGVIVAGRHVWLQQLPADQVPECGPGLEYMLQAFPFQEAIKMVFTGSGECAQVQWTILGLSIPTWTLMVFITLCLFAVSLVAGRWTGPDHT